MKVISFSRYFPAKHPKKGQETLFLQKILISLIDIGHISISKAAELGRQFNLTGMQTIDEIRKLDLTPKHHTIRAGNRWKEGDWFSPRFWTGSPYNRMRDGSKPVEFVPGGIQIAKVFTVEVCYEPHFQVQKPIEENKWHLLSNGVVAENDGLSYGDFEEWFKIHPKKEETFVGQIICWNPDIKY